MSVISPSALAARRRARLRTMLELARVVNGWSRQSLARRLGRDPTKLVPASGNPKVDLVIAMSDALGWGSGEIVDELWADSVEVPETDRPEPRSGTFEHLHRQALAALEDRRWDDARAAVVSMRRQVGGAPSRLVAVADDLEAAAWSGAGCHATALAVCRRGLSQGSVEFSVRLRLLLRLARSNYELWHLLEARAIATELISELSGRNVESRMIHRLLAGAHAIRGHASRRLIGADAANLGRHVRDSIADLSFAEREYRSLHEDSGSPADLGASHLHRGGALEVRATGERRFAEAVDAIVDGLDQAVDLDSIGSREMIEPHGWWCVFGCNLALRGLDDVPRSRCLAILTNKAFEIADRIDNWSIRERAFTFEHFRRQRIGDDSAPAGGRWILDEEDLGHVLGTMGRFPSFRTVGWQILESCGLLEE